MRGRKTPESGVRGALGRHSCVVPQRAEHAQGSSFRSASVARRHLFRLEALVVLVSCVETFLNALCSQFSP
jgi:hypothetical protein